VQVIRCGFGVWQLTTSGPVFVGGSSATGAGAQNRCLGQASRPRLLYGWAGGSYHCVY
jgi:hypothetical protein